MCWSIAYSREEWEFVGEVGGALRRLSVDWVLMCDEGSMGGKGGRGAGGGTGGEGRDEVLEVVGGSGGGSGMGTGREVEVIAGVGTEDEAAGELWGGETGNSRSSMKETW